MEKGKPKKFYQQYTQCVLEITKKIRKKKKQGKFKTGRVE